MKLTRIKGIILAIVITAICTTVIAATSSKADKSKNQITDNLTITTIIETTEKATKKTKKSTKPSSKERVIKKPAKKPAKSVEKNVESTTKKHIETTIPKKITNANACEALYSASYFRNMGVIWWDGWKWTWYSERVLPGGGLNIPGRHGDSNGYICDENNYICLSSSSLSKGTVINTPFGKMGKVYDTGCPSNTTDVYVNW